MQVHQRTMISGKVRGNNEPAARIECNQAAVEQRVELRDEEKAVEDIQPLLVARANGPWLRVAGAQRAFEAQGVETRCGRCMPAHRETTSRPSCIAAAHCRESAETNTSAPATSAAPTWIASMARSGWASSAAMARWTTWGEVSHRMASSRSARRSAFSAAYWASPS